MIMIQHKINSIVFLFLISSTLFSCEDELPVVNKVSNLDAYIGDWQGAEIITLKSDASGDTVSLEETLRLIADSPTEGRFEVVDTLAMVVNEGVFTVSEITNEDLSLPPARILRLRFLIEDDNDEFEQGINGENVYYDYETYNIQEVSANTLVLTDATSDSDLVTYTYVK